MTIDPLIELAFWRELAWDTWQRGHRKLAREIWGQALNEYADPTAASPRSPSPSATNSRHAGSRRQRGGVRRKQIKEPACKLASSKLKGPRP